MLVQFASVYFPRGQMVHVLQIAFDVGLHCCAKNSSSWHSAMHSEQTDAPSYAYFPWPHPVQMLLDVAAVAAENVPFGQDSHTDIPILCWNFPAGHTVQPPFTVLPSPEKPILHRHPVPLTTKEFSESPGTGTSTALWSQGQTMHRASETQSAAAKQPNRNFIAPIAAHTSDF